MAGNETLDTYNSSAPQLAEYFRGIGPRIKYIDRALDLAQKNDGSADILEIGCGDGRDASAIVKKTRSYRGIDYSASMIDIAKHAVPNGEFMVADMSDYQYPEEAYDVVFAFASVLHLDRIALGGLMVSVAKALRPNGIFYISTKYRPTYQGEWKEDEFGRRLFYFYNQEEIRGLSSGLFDVVFEEIEQIKGNPWVETALRKI